MSTRLEDRVWLVAALLSGVAACGEDETPADSDSDDDTSSDHVSDGDASVTNGDESSETSGYGSVELSGSIQKGPFVLGSSISIAPIDAAGEPLGDVYPTMTDNDLGEFEVALPMPGAMAIESTGFYYNEVTGALSGAPLTLRAIYVSSGPGPQEAYVNLITHLTNGRVRQLLADGAEYGPAIAQAEDELRVALGVGLPDFDPNAAGTEMTVLGGDTPANAYLLAVSSVLAQAGVTRAGGPGGPVDANLQELVNQMSVALASAGTIGVDIRAEIDAADLALDSEVVMSALAARLVQTGSMAEVPDIDQVLDSDDDLHVNAVDNCPKAANAGQENEDGDAVGDACDNCPDVGNDAQIDLDRDEVGDACDSMCGDGVTGPGEDCDDSANGDNTDECTDECAVPVCGDTIIWAGEDCDDGNAIDGDGCNAGCVASGQVIWEVLWDASGSLHLAVDSTGAAVYSGEVAGVPFLRKESTDGAFEWQIELPANAYAVTIDAGDEILITTQDAGPSTTMRRLSPGGMEIDAVSFGGGYVYGLDKRPGSSLAFGGEQSFAARYGVLDDAFEIVWEELIPPVITVNNVYDVAVRPDGSAAYIVAIGGYPTTVRVIVHDAGGGQSWDSLAGEYSGELYVAAGPDGEVVACFAQLNGQAYDVAVRKFDSDGAQQWAYDFDGPLGASDACMGVVVDSKGRVVFGYIESEPTDEAAAHAVKLDGDGTLLWTFDYPQADDPSHYTRDVGVDANDEVLVLVHHDPSGASDVWLGKLTE